MNNKDSLQGIVLQCDEIGLVEKVVRDDLDLCRGACPGKPFTFLFHTGMVNQALDFLMQIKLEGFAFDRWFALSDERYVASLHFSGFFVDQKVWIIGAGNSSAMFAFINQLQQINNEQANQIRLLAKQKMDQQLRQTEPATGEERNVRFLLDEMSRLNNELVNLQREMAKKNAELERVNDLKNKFLGMAAHDLRNPLGNIMALAEFLKEEIQGTLNEEQQEFLNMISTSAEFMLKLIEDLLDITKIESGKLNLKLEETDLTELAERNILFNNAMAAKKNISISLTCPKRPVFVKIDRQKIEQVFNNLLTNAVKFSHPGGTVVVTLSLTNGRVRVAVADRGTGIPEKYLETIFQPFNKVSGSGTAGEKSTGLGLSIVKKIIEGHHGQISVESTVGEGSQFTFELPLTN